MLILAYMSFYKPDKNVVMKKLFLILGILIAQCTINMAQVPTLLPDYPITKGVSAPFAGFIKVAISRQFLQPKEEKKPITINAMHWIFMPHLLVGQESLICPVP